jgi:hypothetical protein
MLLRAIEQDKKTHALETRPLPRLRTPLLVLRRWPSAGEVESGITPCTDVIGVRNRRFVCVLACEWCVKPMDMVRYGTRKVRPTISMVSLLSGQWR